MSAPPVVRTLSRALRRVRRSVLTHRRVLAAVLVAIAVTVGVNAAAGPPPPTTAVLTAARDVPGGTVLERSDLVVVEFSPGSVPAGARSWRDALGRTTTGPMRRGEPVTDARMVQASLLDGYPGLVAAPVRVPDAGVVDLLRVGDRIDILAADAQGDAEPVTVSENAPVIAIPAGDDTASPGLAGSALGGRLVVVAVTSTEARGLAQSAVSGFLSVLISS